MSKHTEDSAFADTTAFDVTRDNTDESIAMAGQDEEQEKSNSPGNYKVTLPFFTGVETASLRADHFLRMVEQCARINGWNEQAKVNAAMLNLRDTAQAWSVLYFEKMEKEKKTLKWAPFKEAFLERFHRKTTVADKQALLSKLRQRAGENVDDFMDRIDLTISDVEEFDNKQAVYFFLQGVPPTMKKFLEENKDLKTREDFLNAGRAFEKAHGPTNADALIHSMETKDEDKNKEDLVEAITERLEAMMRRRRNNFRPVNRGQFTNRGRRNGPRRTQSQGQTKNGQSQGVMCFRCKRMGHFARNCRIPRNLIAELNEWDNEDPEEATEPEGNEVSYTLEHNLN